MLAQVRKLTFAFADAPTSASLAPFRRAYISNKQLLPFFSRFFKPGNKICVTRDTKLDAKRAARLGRLGKDL